MYKEAYRITAISIVGLAVAAMAVIGFNATVSMPSSDNQPLAEHRQSRVQDGVQKSGSPLSATNKQPDQPKSSVVHVGNILEWKAPDDLSLYVKDNKSQWYRASFFGPCPGLSQTKSPQFAPELSGYLDHSSSVFVDGERCPFKSFKTSSPPQADNPKGSKTHD